MWLIVRVLREYIEQTASHRGTSLIDYVLEKYEQGKKENKTHFEEEDLGIETARILLNAGADINAQDKEGNTALVNAVKNGNIYLAAFLVASGANTELSNVVGATPLKAVLAAIPKKVSTPEITRVTTYGPLPASFYENKMIPRYPNKTIPRNSFICKDDPEAMRLADHFSAMAMVLAEGKYRQRYRRNRGVIGINTG